MYIYKVKGGYNEFREFKEFSEFRNISLNSRTSLNSLISLSTFHLSVFTFLGAQPNFLSEGVRRFRSAKKPPMGSTWRTSHWWLFLLAEADVPLITRNYSHFLNLKYQNVNPDTESINSIAQR